MLGDAGRGLRGGGGDGHEDRHVRFGGECSREGSGRRVSVLTLPAGRQTHSAS